MAQGYPDYFGQSVFPKYGGLIVGTNSVNVPDAVAYQTIRSANVKAIIPYIQFSASGCADIDQLVWHLYLDSSNELGFSPEAMIAACSINGRQGLFDIIHYDKSAGYVVGITNQLLTCVGNFTVKGSNNSGAAQIMSIAYAYWVQN